LACGCIFKAKPTNLNLKIEEKPMINKNIISLPEPSLKGEKSLEETIISRRSRRNFKSEPLTLNEVSQILWAAQGITDKSQSKRSAPSAGALYPLDIYVAVGKGGIGAIHELPLLNKGVYHFLPEEHSLEVILKGKDVRDSLADACFGQMFIVDAPVVIVITAEYSRTIGKYGQRGIQYVHQETGHVGQNIYLQVESLGLGTVTVGAFDKRKISQILNLPESYIPMYVMPIGHRSSKE